MYDTFMSVCDFSLFRWEAPTSHCSKSKIWQLLQNLNKILLLYGWFFLVNMKTLITIHSHFVQVNHYIYSHCVNTFNELLLKCFSFLIFLLISDVVLKQVRYFHRNIIQADHKSSLHPLSYSLAVLLRKKLILPW